MTIIIANFDLSGGPCSIYADVASSESENLPHHEQKVYSTADCVWALAGQQPSREMELAATEAELLEAFKHAAPYFIGLKEKYGPTEVMIVAPDRAYVVHLHEGGLFKRPIKPLDGIGGWLSYWNRARDYTEPEVFCSLVSMIEGMMPQYCVCHYGGKPIVMKGPYPVEYGIRQFEGRSTRFKSSNEDDVARFTD